MAEATTQTLADFLLARIAEDEAAAESASAASGHPAFMTIGKHWQSDRSMVTGAADLWDDEGVESLGMAYATAQHVARWDPARVLAECEAKRRIVEDFHQFCGEGAGHWPTEYRAYCEGCSAAQYAEQQMSYVLKFLALPYADHPDYREEWRP